MNFSKHKFKVFDFIKLSFIVSPINAGLKIINIIISALLPSAFVLATEKFIDIAIGVHSGKYPFEDVYIPIGLLFALVVYQNMNKSLFHFADIKLSFKMQKYIQNQVINKRATLDYFHIENSDDWDLINRVCNEPSSHLLEGYNSLLQLFRIIVSLVSYSFSGIHVPIGTPIRGMKGWVLNEDYTESDLGELYIGGVGVVNEYISNKKLSAEKFIKLPYFNEPLYKTGDLVEKINENGELIYLGRVDNLVKIRGYRVELEEIEAHLNQFNGIKQAVVRLLKINTENNVLKITLQLPNFVLRHIVVCQPMKRNS